MSEGGGHQRRTLSKNVLPDGRSQWGLQLTTVQLLLSCTLLFATVAAGATRVAVAVARPLVEQEVATAVQRELGRVEVRRDLLGSYVTQDQLMTHTMEQRRRLDDLSRELREIKEDVRWLARGRPGASGP